MNEYLMDDLVAAVKRHVTEDSDSMEILTAVMTVNYFNSEVSEELLEEIRGRMEEATE